MINVSRGTQYAIPVTALIDFSDIVQHSEPSDIKPDITSAHDPGTSNDATTSMNCFNDVAGCVTYEWASPTDAVAAALIAEAGAAEYSIEEGVGATAEIVILFPLRYPYALRVADRPNGSMAQPGDALIYSDVGLSAFNREGESLHPPPNCTPIGGIQPDFVPRCGTFYERTDNVTTVVDVLSLNATVDEYETPIVTPILGAESEGFSSTPTYPMIPDSGAVLLTMLNPPDGLPILLQSNSGASIRGVPFIAIMMQEVKNETLVGEQSGERVRANYGTSFPFTYTQPDFLR
ncbi:MAG: hypothetical protein AAGH19_06040 [Pseudomonadota bacterium]